jgi:hypothetical protein
MKQLKKEHPKDVGDIVVFNNEEYIITKMITKEMFEVARYPSGPILEGRTFKISDPDPDLFPDEYGTTYD